MKYRVDKAYASDKKKDGTPLGFMKYSVMIGEDWYELKGDGRENVSEGDTIEATIVETKGKGAYADRTFKHLELPKPLDPQFKAMIDDLSARILVLEDAVLGGAVPPAIEDEPEIDVSDIPF